ncbi:DUF1214 domain-containing protein [Vibrio sp. E150_011]
MEKFTSFVGAIALTSILSASAFAVDDDGVLQSEEDFAKLMATTGTVNTFFGDFELDHSFPAEGEGDRIYDIIDHQRASQLYLWGLPLVAMQRWHEGYAKQLKDYDYNTIVHASTYNERRGILTPNETVEYFWGFTNTRHEASVLTVPKGIAVGMIADMWYQGPSDLGIFGPNNGEGGTFVIVGPNTPKDTIPFPTDDQRVVNVDTDQAFVLARLIGEPDEVTALSKQLMFYNAGSEAQNKIVSGEDKFVPNFQPRGLDYWKLLHLAINKETVREVDRHFMYWLKTLGIEKGKPFNPTEKQKEALIDGAKMGELMAKAFVYDERIEGVLRQNDWRMVLGGPWGEGIKYDQSVGHYETFDPRARYAYEACVTSPAMTIPYTGKAQAYIVKFKDDDGNRMKGSNNYIVDIAPNPPAELFWSIVVYDADTRTILDNRKVTEGGKATVGSRTPGLRKNADGSITMLVGPDAPPKGWEANHVRSLPNRGWFPYFRGFGAGPGFFNDEYKLPIVTQVEDFSNVK